MGRRLRPWFILGVASNLNYEKAYVSLIGVLLLLSCEQQNKAGEKAPDSVTFTANEVHFTITELTKEKFKIVERKYTTYYLNQLHERFEGKDIKFDQLLVSALSAKFRFDFGFLQYTTDDNSASSLEYTKQSKWSDLQIKEGAIEIPDLNGNSNNPKVYENLGLKRGKALLDWVAGENLDELKKESIRAQTNFYLALLKEKEPIQYENSCPEYFQQPTNFLSS